MTWVLNRLTDLLEILQKLATWNSLRRFGESAIVRSSWIWLAIVPIAAVIIRQIDNPIEVSIFGDRRSIDLSLPFNWYCFYFSALAFSIGNFLYNFKCPEICKFDTFSDFYQKGHGIQKLMDLYYFGVQVPLVRKMSDRDSTPTDFVKLSPILGAMMEASEKSSGMKLGDLLQKYGYEVKAREEFEWLDEPDMDRVYLVSSLFSREAKREEGSDTFLRISEVAALNFGVSRVLCFISFSCGFLLTLAVFFGGFSAVIDTYQGDYTTHPHPEVINPPVAPPAPDPTQVAPQTPYTPAGLESSERVGSTTPE